MKMSKIITAVVVLSMLFSTMVVLNHLNVPSVQAQPGVDEWGTATTDLMYGTTYSTVKVNTSTWTGTNDTTYFLYYPQYWSGTTGVAQNFTYMGPYSVNGYQVRCKPTQIGVMDTTHYDTVDAGGNAISFNRAGKWIFGPNNVTEIGYIWVNTSTNFTIAMSKTTLTYGSTDSIDITVNEGGSPVGSMIAVLDPLNNTVYNAYRAAGAVATLDQTDLPVAGDYTVLAYSDKDAYKNIYYYQDEGGNAYNASYGKTGIFPVSGYTWASVGPWDPPELNASSTTFTVETGVPAMTLTNTTLYWGYYARIDMNITNSTGKGLNDVSSVILRKGNTYYTTEFASYIDTFGNAGNYSIIFPAWTQSNPGIWGDPLVNGTWYVVFGWDKNSDGTYEWNTSKSFTISGAHPPVRIELVDPSKGKIDNTPAYLFGGETPTVDIVFSILGRNLTGDRAYYGDQAWEDWNNISVTGDILFPICEDTLTHSGSRGNWTATVTPTKPNSIITIKIDWQGDDNGTATKTVTVVNGTNVATSINHFTIGQDVNFTVTATDPDGLPLKYANVTLVWGNSETQQNSTTGTNAVGKGKDGVYSFWIKHKWMPDSAPDNLTVMVRSQTSGGFWGYAAIMVERNHDMVMNLTPTTGYAGDGTQYDTSVGLTAGGHPENSGLTIAIYNNTGAQLTPDGWPITGKYNPSAQEINLPGGTYTLFAFNDTHDSTGHNATLVISNYTVTSSPNVLAWKVDNETNMTFQVNPSANGSLRLQNMSSNPKGAILGENTTVDIIDGVGTLESVNATDLGNITFFFTPEKGSEQPAIGLLRVTTATATPSPANIYINEATTVVITITHPATNAPIAGVWVSLDRNGTTNFSSVLSKVPSGKKTDAAGKATFAVNAQASGNVTIYIENVTDPDNQFVIVAGGRSPMAIILASPTVNEGQQFTADIKSGSQLVTGVTVTITYAGATTTTTTGHVTLTAPTVTTNIPYTIAATAVGYADASAQITVLNVPKLIIAVLTTTIKAGQDFQVAVADDSGAPIIGATVTLQGTTARTGAGGVATLKAPTTQGDYTLTATFGTYDQATQSITVGPSGGVPGFELITLIVAIGIAFILIRRRR